MDIPEIILHWKTNYEQAEQFKSNNNNYLKELRNRAIICINEYKYERERIKQRQNDELELKKFFDKLNKL